MRTLAEVQADIAKIEAVSGPLRAAHDKLYQDTERELNRLRSEIRAAEAGLYDLKMELARVARASPGHKGMPAFPLGRR